MDRVRLTRFFHLAALLWPGAAARSQVLLWGLAVVPCFGSGCAQLTPSVELAPTTVRIARASGADMAQIPPGKATAATTPNLLAINLDTVFRLAEDQNTQVA